MVVVVGVSTSTAVVGVIAVGLALQQKQQHPLWLLQQPLLPHLP